MDLPHELQVGVGIMRIEVGTELERLEIDPKHADSAVIFRHACEVAHNHYMITGEEMRFRCAIGVLIVTLLHHERHADHEKIVEELRTTKTRHSGTPAARRVSFTRLEMAM